jgi:ATP-dependent RNA helicase DDX19/DBP5
MTAEGHKVASLHGAKDAAERDAIIDRFREGREKANNFFSPKLPCI